MCVFVRVCVGVFLCVCVGVCYVWGVYVGGVCGGCVVCTCLCVVCTCLCVVCSGVHYSNEFKYMLQGADLDPIAAARLARYEWWYLD